MASEVQHAKWRESIRSNIHRAVENKSWSEHYAPHAAMLTTALVMIAERIGEHTQFLTSRRDELIDLEERNGQLLRALERVEPKVDHDPPDIDQR
jgi:hypothetical protein